MEHEAAPSARIWCIYVPRWAAIRFRECRQQRYWAAKMNWFGDMQPHDRLLFVHWLTSSADLAAKGWLRAANAEQCRGVARVVVLAEFIRTYVAFDAGGSVQGFSYRIEIRERRADERVVFSTASYPRACVDAIRSSARRAGRPILAAIPLWPRRYGRHLPVSAFEEEVSLSVVLPPRS